MSVTTPPFIKKISNLHHRLCAAKNEFAIVDELKPAPHSYQETHNVFDRFHIMDFPGSDRSLRSHHIELRHCGIIGKTQSNQIARMGHRADIPPGGRIDILPLLRAKHEKSTHDIAPQQAKASQPTAQSAA